MKSDTVSKSGAPFGNGVETPRHRSSHQVTDVLAQLIERGQNLRNKMLFSATESTYHSKEPLNQRYPTLVFNSLKSAKELLGCYKDLDYLKNQLGLVIRSSNFFFVVFWFPYRSARINFYLHFVSLLIYLIHCSYIALITNVLLDSCLRLFDSK